MRTAKISWTKLRSMYERGGRHRGSGKPSAGLMYAMFKGNVGDQMTRLWLRSGAGYMLRDVVEQAVEVAEGLNEGEGRKPPFRDLEQRREALSEFRDIADRLQPVLEDLILPYDYEAPKQFVASTVVDTGVEQVEVILRGEMDFFVDSFDGYAIYDLKITENRDYWRATLGQLIFYDIAVGLKTSEHAVRWGLIEPLIPPCFTEFRITDQDRREMWSHIIGLL